MGSHLYLYLLAVGIVTALTPWAIVAEIVMLGSRAGARAAVAFTAGWFCAVAFIAAVVAAGFGGADASTTDSAARWVDWVEAVLGLALLALGLRKRMRARSAPTPAEEPRWLRKLDHIGPVVAFAFGTFMINVVFVVDAGIRIAAHGGSASAAAIAVAFYAIVSTASLIAVLTVYFLDRAHAEERLRAMRAWITRNNAALMAWLVILIGVLLAAKGILGLVA